MTWPNVVLSAADGSIRLSWVPLIFRRIITTLKMCSLKQKRKPLKDYHHYWLADWYYSMLVCLLKCSHADTVTALDSLWHCSTGLQSARMTACYSTLLQQQLAGTWVFNSLLSVCWLSSEAAYVFLHITLMRSHPPCLHRLAWIHLQSCQPADADAFDHMGTARHPNTL